MNGSTSHGRDTEMTSEPKRRNQPRFRFKNKAETLSQMYGALLHAVVLPQISFSRQQWRELGRDVFSLSDTWLSEFVIVRSSSSHEDGPGESLAGHFKTIANVQGIEALAAAVQAVFSSFPDDEEGKVFVQPMISNPDVSGVVFTRDPTTSGHYYVINYDNESGLTDTITSGMTNNVKTHYLFKDRTINLKGNCNWLRPLLLALQELEAGFDTDAIDVEFAIDKRGTIYILQVRPLFGFADGGPTSKSQQFAALRQISSRINQLSSTHPFLYGTRSVFGVMPDWNPAEILGVRPRPLALSLYKELVTDSTWAYQRNNYGYKNLRSFPLLINFHGLPYIDVRVSFNSFIPQDIEDDLAEKLVNHYIDSLIERPRLHDKVEFEIIYSCYTLDIWSRLDNLPTTKFSKKEKVDLANSLRSLTNKIIHPSEGLWRADIAKLERLESRLNSLEASSLPPLDKVYWLIEDCKRYGTLPFAGLARAGFIAVQLLKSLVATGILTEQDSQAFLASLNTVSSGISKDFRRMSKEEFLVNYGHLRPGTYDISSPSYRENPDRYFDWEEKIAEEPPVEQFQLSIDKLSDLDALLKRHEIDHDVITLFDFIKGAIEGREFGKFVFTRSLSSALDLIAKWGEDCGVSKDDLSYLDYGEISSRHATSYSTERVLKRSIGDGKRRYDVTQSLVLPPLIIDEENIWDFHVPDEDPNFITLFTVEGEVVSDLHSGASLAGKIIMIPSADPGFDWIFSKEIAGLITQFGGVNSHMAIRASELAIPAVIGSGERYYRKWSRARVLRIDCALKKVYRLQ